LALEQFLLQLLLREIYGKKYITFPEIIGLDVITAGINITEVPPYPPSSRRRIQ